MRWRIVVALMTGVLAAAPGAREAWSAGPGECIVIENFADSAVDAFPAGWQVRKDAGRTAYEVLREGPREFLRAEAKALGVQAAKEREWNLDEYPVLAWSWRPRVFPTGADERTGRNDSVLSVYVLVPYSRIRGPKAVKYVWSAVVPVGTRLSSNAGLTQVRVLRTGTGPSDRWTEERVDARADFRSYFDAPETPTPAGIAVLTDSDDTGSVASGDYADFRACRH